MANLSNFSQVLSKRKNCFKAKQQRAECDPLQAVNNLCQPQKATTSHFRLQVHLNFTQSTNTIETQKVNLYQ